MSRREFVAGLVRAGLAGLLAPSLLTSLGCSSATEEPSASATADASQAVACSGTNTIVFKDLSGTGHDHNVALSFAQIQAGVALTKVKLTALQTNGSPAGGNHTHSIDLSPTQLSSILNGTPVTVTSYDFAGEDFYDTDPGNDTGHNHTVQIFCIA